MLQGIVENEKMWTFYERKRYASVNQKILNMRFKRGCQVLSFISKSNTNYNGEKTWITFVYSCYEWRVWSRYHQCLITYPISFLIEYFSIGISLTSDDRKQIVTVSNWISLTSLAFSIISSLPSQYFFWNFISFKFVLLYRTNID